MAFGSASWRIGPAAALLALGCVPAPGPNCNPAELTAALAAAQPGDTVHLGACRVSGSFTVPAGVTLAGSGRDGTILTGADRRILTLTPGTPGARLADLTVESSGCAAVVASGAGEAAIERAILRASRGIGLGAQDLTSLRLTDVAVSGPIAAADAPNTVPPLPPYLCSEVATHGIVLVDVVSANLSNVLVSGFGAFGALFVRGAATWQGGGAVDNLGTGLEVWAGAATLGNIELCRMRQGLGALEPYGAVFAFGASVQSADLTVCDNDLYGMMHDGATAQHTDLVARGNRFAAVWVQNSTSFGLSGARTLIEGNGFAGVSVVDSTGVDIRDAQVSATVSRLALVGETGSIRAADGIHLVRTMAALQDLVLSDNERVGVLLGLGGATTGTVSLTRVAVDGVGAALGAIAQDGTLVPGWDSGVTRTGATLANDGAFADRLALVGAVGPGCMPVTDMVPSLGLAALLGP